MLVVEQLDIIQRTRYGVTIVGIVGNIATAFIFSQKAFRNNSIGIYCRTLALVDLLLLVVQLINQSFVLFTSSDVFSSISAPCKVVLYANTAIPGTSAWITVVLSIDKLLCVLYPQRFEFMHKRSFQLKIMAFIAFVNLIFYIEVPIYGYNSVTSIKTVTNITVTNYLCALKSIPFYQYFYIFYLIQGFLAPFLFMFASSVMIVRGLYKTRKRIETHENRENKSRRAKDIKFAISSIVLDFLFIALTTPQLIGIIITINDRVTYAFFAYSTALTFTLNFSKSFFAYLFSNSIFRKEIVKIINSIKPYYMSSNSGNTNHNHSKN